MIDLEKERKAFNEQFGIPEPHECFLGEMNPEQDSLILKCNWLGWESCAESKQTEINALQAENAALKEELAQSTVDKDFAQNHLDAWIDRAYKQRAKVEFLQNEVEKFKVKGSANELPRFLDYLIETAKFKHDEEFKDHVLLPKLLNDKIVGHVVSKVLNDCCEDASVIHEIHAAVIEASEVSE